MYAKMHVGASSRYACYVVIGMQSTVYAALVISLDTRWGSVVRSSCRMSERWEPGERLKPASS
jgi:hypothetical protein